MRKVLFISFLVLLLMTAAFTSAYAAAGNSVSPMAERDVYKRQIFILIKLNNHHPMLPISAPAISAVSAQMQYLSLIHI